ncbi:MAG: hypothetical protein H0X27_05345 [Caulobacteraceae bacterium]|nr:hypothetical protein [Caulobacteraceae bacterium]
MNQTVNATLIAMGLAAAALMAQGCARSGGGLPADALDHAIGGAIGDPATCVLLADRASRKVLYRYGEAFNCARPLPACDRPGTLSAQSALALADAADARGASCASNPERTRSVGWAEGRLAGAKRDLIYSAVMEGQRALPGQEISARLEEAFRRAGL